MKLNKPLIVFVFIILAGLFGFIYYKEGTLPVNKNNPVSKIFVIKKGESLSSIAKNLNNEGLIRNKIIFYVVVKKLGIERKIQAGDFRLSTMMDVYDIAKTLTHGTLDVWVTLIEGTRKEEIAQIFSQNLGIPESEFFKFATEGRLFPDTYLMPRDATAGAVIKILERNFSRRYDDLLRKKAKNKGLSDNEVLTLASLVEKEARLDEDRPIVAGIILKRYKNDWALQIDATVQYALGYQPDEKTWWKKILTTDDLKIDSSYNTYKHLGLPPSPIANPGLASIKAVIDADENTPYWYYMSDKKGKMHYAKTIEEHNENVRKYLQ